MKKLLLSICLLWIVINSFSIRNWKLYTNTSHIYDIIEINDKLYQATWGGLEVYNINYDYFERTYTIADGLSDQDIRTVSYLSSSETILIGTSSAGIDRLQRDEFQIPINKTIGLPDNKVNLIVNYDALLYAVTDEGLTVFREVADFPYPLPINHYATHNGLVSKNITSLSISSDGVIFIGTDKGLNYVPKDSMYDLAEWKLIDENNSLLPSNQITALSISEDMLVIGTSKGLVRLNNLSAGDYTQLELITTLTHNIASDTIYAVFVDSDSNIWLSYGVWNANNLIIEQTQNVVISKITPSDAITNWQKNTFGIATNQIKGFKEINGRIFAYTWGDGFYFLDENDWVNRKPDTMTANNITDIAVDLNGKVWICNGFIGPDAQMRANPGVSGFDGSSWTTFRANNSPLVHDKVFRVMADASNRKWFGTWNHGISVYDENEQKWYQFNRNNGLTANEIGALITDRDNNIWISAHTGGVIILELDAIRESIVPILNSFRVDNPIVAFSDVVDIHILSDRAIFGGYYSGVSIWDKPIWDNSVPVFPTTPQAGDSWKRPPPRDLVDGYVRIYQTDSRRGHWGDEIWIASENGLFMFDSANDRWYRYGTGIKREVWQHNNWQRDRLYFVDEERLYGAVSTVPTAIYIDDFERIWIGTESNGITVYDLTTDRYSIYNTNNTPLLSNTITALAYEPYSGNLFIGTDKGLNSVEIGKTIKRENLPLKKSITYPNPFYPEKGEIVTISNTQNGSLIDLPAGNNSCKIYNINGELIITLQENRFFEFSWDGSNSEGKKCGNGVYFYVISSPNGQTERGTIVLVR